MGTWIANHWYVVWGLVGGCAYVGYRVHQRGGNESLPLRIVYVFAPILDAQSETRRGMSDRKLALIAVAMIIFLVVFVYVDNFA